MEPDRSQPIAWADAPEDVRKAVLADLEGTAGNLEWRGEPERAAVYRAAVALLAGADSAYARGAEYMRERAAGVCEYFSGVPASKEIARRIREVKP